MRHSRNETVDRAAIDKRNKLAQDIHTRPMTTKTVFKLAHLSDLHLMSSHDLSASELLNKRMLGYFSWRLHRHINHRREVLSALLQDLQTINMDHIVITGDLTHLGRPVEYSQALEFLHKLGPPSDVTVVPGNHDAYISVDWQQTYALWARYLSGDSDSVAGKETQNRKPSFPMLRIRGQTALIGVSTACPSAPLFATGEVGQVQLQKLENLLIDTGRQGLFRVVLIHHPPVSGVVQWRKRLRDAKDFRAVLKRCGAELILHGHVHRSSITKLQTPHGPVPVVSVSSASALGRRSDRRARFHIYQITPGSPDWEMRLIAYRYSSRQKQFIPESDRRFAIPQAASTQPP